MEQETLFTASKWGILKMLSKGPKSPLQLSKLSNTSVANISQQLRLLEMAGLVQSKRISNRDKGQPRQLYSLVGNHSFLIASSVDFVEKKMLKLSDYNKIILKIWFLEDAKAHYFLEKAFWHLEEMLPNISAIILDKRTLSSETLLLIVASESPVVKRDLKKIQVKDFEGRHKAVLFSVKPIQELTRIFAGGNQNYYALFDPQNIMDIKKNNIEDLKNK